MSGARRWASGLNAALASGLVLAMFAVLAELAHRHPLRIDVSAERSQALDPDTASVLALAESGAQTVTITAFSSQARNEESWVRDRLLRDFLAKLDAASELVTTSFVDFDRDRLTAEQLGVDRYGTVVVQAGRDRVDVGERDVFRAKGPVGHRDVTFVGEPAIAAAIRQVLSERVRTVVLLGGHGEDEIYDRGLGELRQLAARLDGQGLAVRTVDLLRDAPPGQPPRIPDDAAAVIVLGASVPLADAELNALRSWLGQGGAVGLFYDPDDPVPDLLGDLGVALPPGVALDPQSYFPHVDRPILRYGNHPITEPLVRDDVATVVSLARPVVVTPRDGVSAATLLQTSRQGWIERGSEPEPAYTPGEDVGGPVVVAVALTVSAPHPWIQRDSARIAIVGDVDLVRDELMEEGPGNATFVTNVVRWLVRSDQAFSRVGRVSRVRRLELGASRLTALRIVLMGAMPLAAAVAGIAVLAIRRSR